VQGELENPEVWNDPEEAQRLGKDRARLEAIVNTIVKLDDGLSEAHDLLQMAGDEDDAETVGVVEADIAGLDKHLAQLEFRRMFNGELDSSNAFLDIQSGAGGTEAQDWAQMLVRMYARWAEAHGYKIEWLEESSGEEAGLKSATFRIKGDNAYGWLKTESGVHRLVRISPFDSQSRRHTSFASAWVYPVVDDAIEIEIVDKDLRVDTYRASGAGGQHVNKTDSAVRMTHLPSGIVVQCQNDRSQHKNRAEAMKMLRARLYEAELRKREEVAQAEAAAKSDIGWGHQIRSYVLQPYQMVKDLRTGAETGNVQAVLDGDIDAFLEASLADRLDRDSGAAAESAAPDG